jgi:hypothetical protein
MTYNRRGNKFSACALNISEQTILIEDGRGRDMDALTFSSTIRS